MTLVTERFAFAHIPRAGGSFIKTVLAEHFTVVHTGPAHEPIPDEWRHLPAFCVIRNPWDWHVSWYHHLIARGPQLTGSKGAVWESVTRSGEADFAESIERAGSVYMDHIRTVVGDFDGLTVLRFERFKKQLLRFLAEHAEVSKDLSADIRRRPPVLASTHGPYRDYYTPELAHVVGERCADVCERFGYRL